MKPVPAFILISFLLSSVGIVEAGEQITLNPNSGHSNQNQINDALKSGDVFLSAGVYEIDGPIYTYPGRKLTLDSNAIIRVWKGSSQFFTGRIGLINCVGVPKNIEISGGEIDGNCDELPSNFHSNDQDPHDCERAIFLIGSSGDYGEDIYIHDIKIYDTFSDGCHVRFCNRVKIANVFESNCEHEGIYFCVVIDGLIYNCEIAGITSDNIRIENSKRIKVDKCLLYSYTGDHNNGAYKGGEAGIQIGDQGRSFGVGSDKPVHTSDIEVCNTIFANNGRMAVALDIAGKAPSDNVFFHHNQFIGASELKTMGIPVEGFDFGNITTKGNMPTKEMSEKIFSSIFDILDRDFSFKYLNHETKINASVDIVFYNNSYNPYSLVYVNGTDLTSIKYEYNGSSTTRYFTVYEGNTTSETTLWEGDISHKGEALFLEGNFDESKLSVTCFNSKGYQKITDFNVKEVSDNSELVLNPALWSFVGTLTILGIATYRNFRRVIRW